MKRYIACILSCFLMFVAGDLLASQKYVATDAGGGGDGSIGTPWTVAEANSNASAGDTINCRGGTYDEGDETFDFGARAIVVIAYPGETPVWDGIAVATVDENFLVFRGLWCKNVSDDNAFYIEADSCYLIRDSIYNVNGDPAAIQIQGSAGEKISLVWIDSCYIDRADTLNATKGVSEGAGDGIEFNAWRSGESYDSLNYLYVGHTTIKRCNHTAINIKGQRITGADGFCAEYAVVEYCSLYTNHNHLDAGGLRYGLLQHNYIHRADTLGDGAGGGQGSWLQLVDQHCDQIIIRGNKGWIDTTSFLGGNSGDDQMIAIALSEEYDNRDIIHVFMYHNTFDATSDIDPGADYMVLMSTSTAGAADDSVAQVYIKNNILAGMADEMDCPIWHRDTAMNFVDMTQYVQGNLIHSDTGVIAVRIDTSAQAKWNLATIEARAQWSDNQWDAPAYNDYSARDYVLASDDPGVGDAIALTTTSGTGSSGTGMKLANARYFSAGLDLIAGDTIYVADMTPSAWASIASVVYAQDSIYLNESRTWGDAKSVNWYVNGEIADDIGAAQIANATLRRFMPMRRD